MAQAILLRGAKQLLTLRGPSGARRGPALRELGLIEDGSVLIRDGMIIAVGTSRRVENLKEARAAFEIPVNGKVVMPGFVDPAINLDLEEHLTGAAEPAKRQKLAEFLDRMIPLLRSCSRHGTLTAELKIEAGIQDIPANLAVFRQLARRSSSIRTVRTCRIGQPTEPNKDTSNDTAESLSELARRKLVRYVEFEAPQELTERDRSFLGAVERSQLEVKLLWPGGAPDKLAPALARLNPVAVSCPLNVTSDECTALAQTSAIAVFSTAKEFFELPNAVCARGAIDLGVAIALSTGYDFRHALTLNMQTTVAFGVLRLRLTPEEAITAATINAACATGSDDSTGSLEAGKQADLLVLDLPDYREISRQFGVNHVEIAMCGESIVFNRTSLPLESELRPRRRVASEGT